MLDRVVVTRGAVSETVECSIQINDRKAYFSGFIRLESGDEFLHRKVVWQIAGVKAYEFHTEVEFLWLRESTV